MPVIAAPMHHRSPIRYHSLLQLVFLLFASSLPLIASINPLFARTPSTQPVSSIQTHAVIPSRPVCRYAGVLKDANGIYHFSWLHVDSATGYIMDAHNCIVDLRGFNSAGTEYADAVSPFPGLNSQRLAWFNSMFKMNYLRLNLNVGWWNSNVYVPDAQMYYRAWIQQWISWAEQNGDYVLLNRTNEYQLPPCGGTITYCPAQGEPSDL